MKTTCSALLALVLLLGTVPAVARRSDDCDAGCMRLRRQSDALKAGSASTHIRRNTGLLQDVRRNRRSDSKDRYGVRRSDARNRVLNTTNLRIRRQGTLQRRHERLVQNQDRADAAEERRQNLLRSRVKTQARTSIRGRAMSRIRFRSYSKSLDSQAQRRREAVKSAHEKCRELRGADRLQCLRDERAKALDKTE